MLLLVNHAVLRVTCRAKVFDSLVTFGLPELRAALLSNISQVRVRL